MRFLHKLLKSFAITFGLMFCLLGFATFVTLVGLLCMSPVLACVYFGTLKPLLSYVILGVLSAIIDAACNP